MLCGASGLCPGTGIFLHLLGLFEEGCPWVRSGALRRRYHYFEKLKENDGLTIKPVSAERIYFLQKKFAHNAKLLIGIKEKTIEVLSIINTSKKSTRVQKSFLFLVL